MRPALLPGSRPVAQGPLKRVWAYFSCFFCSHAAPAGGLFMNQAISDLFQLELPQLEARLARLLGDIMPPDEAARAACKARWDAVGKPLGSLGLLETDTQKIAALTGSAKLDLSARTLLVFCADNGVVAQGVSQCGNEVTGFVTRALAEGRSSACTMARVARCRVQPVDMGVHGLVGEEISGLVRCRVMDGTADFTQGPAMTRTQALQALLAGAALARQQAETGCRLLLIGEMGIGNTTTSSAVAAVLLGCPPEAVTGRGAGLSNAGLARKLAAIRAGIAQNRPDPADPLAVLAALGGLDIAAMAGACLGAAAARVPLLLDGFISTVAALAAVRLCPAAEAALLASHRSAEPAGQMLLDALGLSPLLCAGLRLGEGTGALAALPLFDMAMAMYGGAEFSSYGMDAYTPQN